MSDERDGRRAKPLVSAAADDATVASWSDQSGSIFTQDVAPLSATSSAHDTLAYASQADLLEVEALDAVSEVDWEVLKTVSNVALDERTDEVKQLPQTDPDARLSQAAADRLRQTFETLSQVHVAGGARITFEQQIDRSEDAIFSSSPELDALLSDGVTELEDDELELLDMLDPLDPLTQVRARADEAEHALELDDADLEEILDPLAEVSAGVLDPDTSPERISPASAQARLQACLDAISARVELKGPWASCFEELCAELNAQPVSAVSQHIVFLCATILRLHGDAGLGLARQLEDAAHAALGPLRPALVERVIDAWRAPLDALLPAIDALRAHELSLDIDPGEVAERHIGILAARALAELDHGVPDARLAQRLDAHESVMALATQALARHRGGDRAGAAGYWSRLSDYLRGAHREEVNALAAVALVGEPALFAHVEALDARGEASSLLWRMAAMQARAGGEPMREVQAMHRLCALEPDPEDVAAHLILLAPRVEALHRAGAREEALREPVALWRSALRPNSASAALIARQLERLGVARADVALQIEALATQVEALDAEPLQRALAIERLAWLLREQGGELASWREALEEAIALSAQCLPALVMLGQDYIEGGTLAGALRLRASPSHGERAGTDPVWRRAELLERVGGDPREILSLYQGARREDPDAPHLFFCEERALAVLGQWRGLLTVLDATSPALRDALSRSGLDLDTWRLALVTYLEDVQPPSVAQLDAHVSALSADTPWRDDAPMFWRRVAADALARQRERALARVDAIVAAPTPEDEDEAASELTRALLWQVYLLAGAEGDADERVAAREQRAPWRALLARSVRPMVRRFAAHAALRAEDHAWLAAHLMAHPSACWIDAIDGRALAAELWLLTDTPARAEEALRPLLASDDEATAREARGRLISLLTRSGRWRDALALLGDAQDAAARASLTLHMIACAATPEPVAVDADAPLCDALTRVELMARQRDWQGAACQLEATLSRGEGPAGEQAALAALLVQIALRATRDHALAAPALARWQALQPEPAGALDAMLMLSAQAIVAAHSGDAARLERALARARERFGDEVAAQLQADACGASAPQASEPQATRYRRVAQALDAWMSASRSRHAGAALVDALDEADASPAWRYLIALAQREDALHASMEVSLASLASQEEAGGLSQWARERGLTHLAMTQRCAPEALAQLDVACAQAPWRGLGESLLAVAVAAEAPLRAQQRLSLGHWSDLLCAQQAQDLTMLAMLAGAGCAGAALWAEARAALERRDWRAQDNLELSHAALRASLIHDTQDQARARFVDSVTRAGAAVIASPWCPLRLVEHDLSRLGLDGEPLARLEALALEAPAAGVGAELRLLVARQLARVGQRQRALALAPREAARGLIGLAWGWLGLALGEGPDGAGRAAQIMMWRARVARASAQAHDAMHHELSRALERAGQRDEALAIAQSLAARGFVPAQVAAARLLIVAGDWEGLAALWEQALTRAQAPDERAGLAFRLGLLHERRLGRGALGLASARPYYEEVLRAAPHHQAALFGLTRVAWAMNDEALAARCALAQADAPRASDDWRATLCLERAVVHRGVLDVAEVTRASEEAARLWPREKLALWSCVLAAGEDAASAVRALERALGQGAKASPAVGDALTLRVIEAPRALQALREHYPAQRVWRVLQLVEGLERAALHEEALAVLGEGQGEDAWQTTLRVLELLHVGVGAPRWRERVQALTRQQPAAQGLALAALSRSAHDLETRVALWQVAAPQERTPLARASAWTRVALVLWRAGRTSEALAVCEQLLERHGEFLPAVKLARSLSAATQSWAALARWAAREAELSHDPELAMRCRLLASEVQRQRLGDLSGARAQLELVLSRHPAHEDAFERLMLLLVQTHDIDSALALCEQRLALLTQREARVSLLNEMADLALHHHQPPARAIQYLSASLGEEPSQLQRLRVLGELYERVALPAQAIMCYEAATQLARDARLLATLYQQIGELYDEQLAQPARAARAYEQVLRYEAPTAGLLAALAKALEDAGELQGALDALARLEELSHSPQALVQARQRRLGFLTRQGASPDQLAESARAILSVTPEDEEALGVWCEALARQGRQSELEPQVRSLLLEALAHQPSLHGPLVGHFRMASRLGLLDLAYTLAGVTRWLGVAELDMHQWHERVLSPPMPQRPMPPALTAGMLPEGMSLSLLELLRRTDEALLRACEPLPYAPLLRWRGKLSQPSTQAHVQAMRWPELFGLTLRDVHLVTERLPLGSALIYDDGVRLLLDPQWEPAIPNAKLLVGLGTQLASWSMGVGMWTAFTREVQLALLARIVQRHAPRWVGSLPQARWPAWFQVEQLDQWLAREAESLAPYALDLAGRLGPAALTSQLTLVELAMERLACVVMPDLHAALPHTVRLGVEGGPQQRPWAFVFDPAWARLRHAVGVAQPQRSS